jgi:hypothetical protein
VVVTPALLDLFATKLASLIWETIGAHPVITASEELWSHKLALVALSAQGMEESHEQIVQNVYLDTTARSMAP